MEALNELKADPFPLFHRALLLGVEVSLVGGAMWAVSGVTPNLFVICGSVVILNSTVTQLRRELKRSEVRKLEGQFALENPPEAR